MIDLQQLHDRLGRAIGVSSPAYTSAFLQSVNDVVSDLNTLLGTELDQIEGLQDEIDMDNNKYGRVFRDGVRYYVLISGEWGREPDIPAALRRYQEAKAAAHFHYIEDSDLPSGVPEGDWS